MASADRYLDFLPRHAKESERLNLQHELLTSNLGYLLHPTIAASLPASGVKIADVGTGTGIWLTELAKELPPDTNYHGLDSSAAQFPSDTTDKFRFTELDARVALPDELRSTFDVVHIRFISAGLHKDDDWEAVIRNCFEMLKPGGWLQWHEEDFKQGSIALRTDPKLRTPAFSEFLGTIIPRLGFLFWSKDNLEALFRSSGFEEVLDEATSTDRVPETRIPYTAMTVGALKITYEKFAREREEINDEEMEKRLQKVDEEITKGAYFRADMHVYIGRKPKS